jgi:hypothetical protein
VRIIGFLSNVQLGDQELAASIAFNIDMPGKYSYGLVLAQYSSQGIISLPNNNYLKSSHDPRASSAVVLRPRTDSNATKCSCHLSITSGSVKSTGGTPQPRTSNLTPRGTVSNHRRIFIVQSDSSEDEDESEAGEWIRPHSRLASTPTQGVEVRDYGSLQQQSPLGQPSPRVPATSQRPKRPAEVKSEVQRKPNPPKTTRPRGGGVKAFIQARHEAEMKSAAAWEPHLEQEGEGISLREFVQTAQKFSESRARQITVQEFLASVPHPVTDQVEPLPEGNHYPPAFLGTTQGPRSKSVLSQRSPGRTTSTAVVAAVAPNKAQDVELNFDGFSAHVDLRRFSLPIMSKQRAGPKVTARSPEAPSMTSRLENSGSKSSAFSETCRQRQEDGSEPAVAHRLRHLKRLEPLTKQTKPHHAQSLSWSASLGSEAPTQATSEYSFSSGPANRARSSESWTLAHLQEDYDVDSFAHIVDELNEKITIFTSDEEDENTEEGDLPTPRLQSIPESATFPSRRWGTISSGQHESARCKDDDEMSETSAVFPPDIGRYKYVCEGEGPLALTFSEMADDEGKSKGSKVSKGRRGKLRRGVSKTGLLERLRLRSGR